MTPEVALWVAIAAGVAAILFGVFSVQWVLRQPAGNERMHRFDQPVIKEITLGQFLARRVELTQQLIDGRRHIRDVRLLCSPYALIETALARDARQLVAHCIERTHFPAPVQVQA